MRNGINRLLTKRNKFRKLLEIFFISADGMRRIPFFKLEILYETL